MNITFFCCIQLQFTCGINKIVYCICKPVGCKLIFLLAILRHFCNPFNMIGNFLAFLACIIGSLCLFFRYLFALICILHTSALFFFKWWWYLQNIAVERLNYNIILLVSSEMSVYRAHITPLYMGVQDFSRFVCVCGCTFCICDALFLYKNNLISINH